MDEKRYRLADTALSLPRDAAGRLLSLRDGDCALLYIYLLRTGGEFSPAQVSSALSMPENRVLAAGEKLRQIFLQNLFQTVCGRGGAAGSVESPQRTQTECILPKQTVTT